MKQKGIVWNEQPLGEVTDKVLAERLGCSIAAVAAARHRRKIPALRGKKPDRDLARVVMGAYPRGHHALDIPTWALLLYVGTSTTTVKELRDGLGIGQSTASELVKRAEVAGWVTADRPRPSRVGRETFVRLTPKALQTMKRRRRRPQALRSSR